MIPKPNPHRNGDRAIVKEKRGPGSDWRLTPDPRTTANLNRKSRVVA